VQLSHLSRSAPGGNRSRIPGSHDAALPVPARLKSQPSMAPASCSLLPESLRNFNWDRSKTRHTAWRRSLDCMDPSAPLFAPFAGAGFSLTSRSSTTALGSSWCTRAAVWSLSREFEPEALARWVGWSMTLEALGMRLRCSQCGKRPPRGCGRAKPRRLTGLALE